MYQYLQIEKTENEIAIIHIQRPEAKNALNMLMVTELKEAITKLENDNEVLCVILRGDSNYFIAGADIKEMVGLPVSEAYKFSRGMKALHDLIIQSSMPYIAAIQGYCLGGGLELALACDIRLADGSVKLGLPEVKLGIIPGGGGIQRILDVAGSSFTSQFVMTGELIDAEEADKLNIVNKVNKDVMSEAFSIARSITSKSSYAIAASKKLISQRKWRQSSVELEEELYEFSLLFDYPDSVEGMSAFIEKRKPLFQKGDEQNE